MARVSVIVAAYQAAGTIEDTLRSVLAQSYGDWEIIVGDDCSTDATPQLAEAFGERVRVVRSATNIGTPAATRMMAVAESSAELIAFLDGDDLWQPDYLATMVGAYDREREQSVGAVCCDAELLREDGSVAAQTYMDLVGRPAAEIDLDLLLRRNPVYTSVLLPRAVFDAVGGLTSELRGTDDYDLWIRIGEHGLRIVFVDRPLARYRVRASSLSGDQRAMAGAAAEVYRRALRRGRLSARAAAARAARDPHAGRRGPRRRARGAAAANRPGARRRRVARRAAARR